MFSPAIIALLLSSLLVSGMVVYAAFFGLQVLHRWDLASGSASQLALERRTYLVSSILVVVMVVETASLFLFIHTADSLHRQFVGAMCAAGVLLVNGYGYPALLFKVAACILAGVWLVINYADNRAHDYPLIRKKYLLLLLLAPLVLAETVMQGSFFLALHPDVITSCCGSLFSAGGRGIAAGLAGLPLLPAVALFASGLLLTMGSGLYFYRTGRGGLVFGGLSGINFVVALISLVSFISLYFYELPTHHCPFCILQRGYDYIGYPLYLALLVAVVCGLGVGGLQPFRRVPSLRRNLPLFQRRLTLAALIALLFFTVLVLVRIFTTGFTMR